MRRYARIEDRRVMEIVALPPAAKIKQRYHPSLRWVEITPRPEVQVGWVLDLELGFAAPDDYRLRRRAAYPPIGDQLDALLEYCHRRQLAGESVPADLDAIIGQWLSVKRRHPKPDPAGA